MSFDKGEKIFIALLLFIATGCGQSSKNSVFQKYLTETQKDKTWSEIRLLCKDSLQSWMDRGLYDVLFLKKQEWEIDSAVFFDKDKSKALLIVLVKVINGYVPVDYTKIIAAEKINNKWRFYYRSYAITDLLRSDNNNKPYTFSQLSKSAREDLIDDGFVTCNPACHIQHDYVDSDLWFQNWRREYHDEFVNGQYIDDPLGKPGQRMN